MAAGMDRPASELDCKGAVPVGAGEGALVQDEERPVQVGFLCRDAEAVLDQPILEIDSFFRPLYFLWSARQRIGQLT